MTHFLLTLFLSGLFLYLVASLAPGVSCSGILPAMLASLVFSILMGVFRPSLMGYSAAGKALVSLLAAAFTLWLSGLLVPGFHVDGLSGGIAGVLTFWLLQMVLLALLV